MINEGFQLWPRQASTFAPELDLLYGFLLLVTALFSVPIAGLIIYFCVKYRRGSKADRTTKPGNTLVIEALWFTIPFGLSMVMFYWGASLFFRQFRSPAGAVEIQVVGRQWMWKMQHPEGNSEINELHVPVGRPVRLSMISEDVIHSFYIPAFRTKHDVLPGRYTSLWFQATQPGEYYLFCAEYCGAKHAEMGGRVVVMEPSEYEAWLSGATAGESPAEAGRRLFEELRCDTCHQGAKGRGPPLENLLQRPVQLQDGRVIIADEDYIRESILRPQAKVVAGFQPIMPAFEGQIGEEGILHLIAYLRTLSAEPGAEGGPRAQGPARPPLGTKGTTGQSPQQNPAQLPEGRP